MYHLCSKLYILIFYIVRFDNFLCLFITDAALCLFNIDIDESKLTFCPSGTFCKAMLANFTLEPFKIKFVTC